MHPLPPDAFVAWEDHARSSAVRLEVLGDVDHDALLTGAHATTAPIAVRAARKGRRNDVIFSTGTGVLAVSPAWVHSMQTAGLTGWGLYPIHVTGAGAETVQGYQGLSITGRSGPPMWDASEEVLDPPGLGGLQMRHHRGIHPVPDSWDGSDFFIPDDTFMTCMTARAVEVHRTRTLRGLVFEPLSSAMIPTV